MGWLVEHDYKSARHYRVMMKCVLQMYSICLVAVQVSCRGSFTDLGGGRGRYTKEDDHEYRQVNLHSYLVTLENDIEA